MRSHIEQSRRGPTACAATILAVVAIASGVSLPLHAAKGAPALALEVRSSTTLQKEGGRVDEALPTASGWAIRDYSWKTPAKQRVEFYGPKGAARGAIAAYGHEPNQYVRLRDMAVDDESRVWIADFGSDRILAFDTAGKLVRSFLLQNPSYRPKALALDPQHDRLYVAGCYPTHTFLDQGCRLIHQYRLSDGRFIRSFLETDPDLVAKRWAVLGDDHLAVGSSGQVFFVQEPELKLWRLDPATGKVTGIRIDSAVAKPVPALTPDQLMQDGATKVLAASYRVDQVWSTGKLVVVSIGRPNDAGYLLEVFDQDGKQVAKDLPAPGRLVGSTREGSWVFARQNGSRFALDVGLLKQATSP